MAVRFEWDFAPARIFRPASILLALVNLVPLPGVILWGWDVFLVLLLFWFETATIAFWSIVGLALQRPGTTAPLGGEIIAVGSPIGMALFFTVHSGIFLGVHFMFLWSLFAGPWPAGVRGFGDFMGLVMVDSGLWIALSGLLLAHGINFLRQRGLDPVRRIGETILGHGSLGEHRDAGQGPGLGLLYSRIIGMQLAIILGGLVALAFGSMGPLLILIVIKTAVDLGLNVSADPR